MTYASIRTNLKIDTDVIASYQTIGSDARQLISTELPQGIGEALPEYHCEKNPRLEHCSDDGLVFLPATNDPFLTVAVTLVVMCAVGFVGHSYVTAESSKDRKKILVGLALCLAGILTPYLFF